MESELRNRYKNFFALTESYFSPDSVGVVESALTLADEKLSGMMRYDGTPLLDHAVGVAMIVISEIGLGRNSTISTILHDVVRLGLLDPSEAGRLFGKECTSILLGLNNISEVDVKQDQTDNFRDLIVSYATDPRVILIKLADRLEVMRSLEMFPPEKRIRKSWESLKLYAEIAHKLGLYSVKSELEDLSLSWLEPDAYRSIESKLRESEEERMRFIAAFLKPIEEKLKQAGIKYKVKSRTKTIYSIWNKMRRMKVQFEEIFDIFALRIIVDCPPEQEKQQCWAVYSVVTDFYTPNPDRLRDWISVPKSNGYESLHTTVVTKDGHWVEIQIRSERMDEVAERGIAAHWRYKGVHQGGMGSEQWLAKLREMVEQDPKDIAQRFGTESTTGEIFVFTPKGDLRKLREGATLLDFAFDIHTNIGASCIGGKVNHRNVPLKYVLKNGDIVEVVTSKTQKPNPGWLKIVKTSKARNKIKAYMREEAAKEASLGREELERRIKNWKLPLAIDDAVNALCRFYKLKTGTELYGRIADESIDMMEVKDVLQRYIDGDQFTETKGRTIKQVKEDTRPSDDSLVIDDSIRNLDYKLAKCCNPIRGEQIFGFVTVSAGITIHKEACQNAKRLREKYPYRVLPAKWRDDAKDGAFQASIRIVADNTTGMLNRITDVISQELRINVRSMSVAPNNRGELTGVINIEVTGVQLVDMVVHRILKIKGVQKAHRIN